MTEVDEPSERTEETSPPPEDAPKSERPTAKTKSAEAKSKAANEERPLNTDGRERPGFLLAFPDDPELQRLVRAFEAGNYEAVRSGAPRLAEHSEHAAVRAAARELRKRIDPDPLMKYLLAVALALFVFVVWYTYEYHSH